MAASGDNTTDAINGALRPAATLPAYLRPGGTVHVLARTARPTSCTCPDAI